MNKSEFIQKASIQLLSANLWCKDMSCFGSTLSDLVDSSIEAAEMLWEKLGKEGYLDPVSEPCEACGGHGVVDFDNQQCDWCKGTGETSPFRNQEYLEITRP